jgi:Lysyl oxidase
MVRFAIAALIAATVGGASLASATSILAQSGATWPGGTSVPSGPTGASGPSGPTGPTRPSAPTPCATPSLRLRCPDLVMSAPFHLHLDRSTIPGRVLLRAASSVNNHGSGPLEVRAQRLGSPAMAVYQAIYDRRGHRHLFRLAARLVFKYVPGERYEHEAVGDFSYWKFEHAAAFQLWSIDAKRRAVGLVRVGPKVAYCLRDLERSRPSASSPRLPAYPACSQDPSARSDVLGTSVGWSDVYPYDYPEQWIDVTGLRGSFAYVQIADPDNLLLESNKRNNISETYVSLPSGRVLGHRVAVAAP